MRPRSPSAASPTSAESVALLGGVRYEGVDFAHGEFAALGRHYGVRVRGAAQRERDPSRSNAELAEVLVACGADRGVARAASHDGLRVMAALARHLRGEDPVQFVEGLMAEAGIDVCGADEGAWADFLSGLPGASTGGVES